MESDMQQSLARGLADSAAGRVTDLGDFTQYDLHVSPLRTRSASTHCKCAERRTKTAESQMSPEPGSRGTPAEDE